MFTAIKVPPDVIIFPLGQNVLLEGVKEKVSSKIKGFVLPTEEKKAPVFAIVLEIGPDVQFVQKGDKVVFSEFNFDPIKVEERELLIGPEEKILGIVK